MTTKLLQWKTDDTVQNCPQDTMTTKLLQWKADDTVTKLSTGHDGEETTAAGNR